MNLIFLLHAILCVPSLYYNIWKYLDMVYWANCVNPDETDTKMSNTGVSGQTGITKKNLFSNLISYHDKHQGRTNYSDFVH